MKTLTIRFLFLILILAPAAIFAQANTLENLFQERRYFDLNDALEKLKTDASPELLFYRGAAANRFNKRETSIALLLQYIKKSGKDAPHLADAYEILADNYTKNFEYGKAADTYKFLLENFRARLDAEEIED